MKLASTLIVLLALATPSSAWAKDRPHLLPHQLPVGSHPNISGQSQKYQKCFKESYRRHPGGTMRHRERDAEIGASVRGSR